MICVLFLKDVVAKIIGAKKWSQDTVGQVLQ